MTIDELRAACAELTLEDWRELTDWIRRQPLEIVQRALRQTRPAPAVERIAIEEATRLAAQLGLLSADGLKHLYSLEGVRQWLYLAMRRKDPKVLLEQVETQVTFANVSAVAAMLEAMNQLADVNAEEIDEANPMSPASP